VSVLGFGSAANAVVASAAPIISSTNAIRLIAVSPGSSLINGD
jgi:hypothetical protein